MKSISENGKNFNLLASEEVNKIKGCQPLDNNNSKNGTFLNCTDIYVLQKSMQDWFYKSSKFYDDYSFTDLKKIKDFDEKKYKSMLDEINT